MSVRLTSSRLLKLAFFALLTPKFAFSSGKVETLFEQGGESEKVVAASATQLSFETIPSEIIKLILENLSRKDLVNLRAVEKKLRDMITPIITNVEIPGNLPNEKQFEKFFTDLTTVEYWNGKKPSEAFVNLFRHAPVKDLTLSDRISADNIATIVPALPTGLKTLELKNSNIGEAGAQALALRLPTSLLHLGLDNNNIGEAGAQALALRLPTSLQWLNLSNNNIEEAGAQALAPHLPTTLQDFWLSHNNIGDAGVQALALRLPTSLLHLGLDNNNIGDAGAQALAPHLPTTLQDFGLSHNNIGDAGAQALATHLPISLRLLDLRGNNIGDVGAQALAPHLPTAFERLDLSGNNIGEVGLSALLEAIPRTDLTGLIISVPSNSPLCQQFKNLHNRRGRLVQVWFE